MTSFFGDTRPDSESRFEEKLITLNRVQKVHKGGRTLRWSALVVVGDGAGSAGVGLGKSAEIPDAIRKAADDARKQMGKIARLGSTIPHPVLARYGAARVLLKPASPGTGVIAGGVVRALLEAAGIKDVLSKSLGSDNPINIARAAMKGLRSLRTAREVAAIRGRKPEEIADRYHLELEVIDEEAGEQEESAEIEE
jgi:small subunit ribosomal protein S5